MFNLQHDGWTTKGNRYAFLGYSVSYIDENFEFVSHHLGLKLISWYHKGEWLSAPMVNVLQKHGLYSKISPSHIFSVRANDLAVVLI